MSYDVFCLILGMVFFVHLLFNFASHNLRFYVNTNLLNAICLTEAIILGCLIVHINLIFPPGKDWILRILVYGIVYFTIYRTWLLMGPNTLKKDKIYEMQSCYLTTQRRGLYFVQDIAVGKIKEGCRTFLVKLDCVGDERRFTKGLTLKVKVIYIKHHGYYKVSVMEVDKNDQTKDC